MRCLKARAHLCGPLHRLARHELLPAVVDGATLQVAGQRMALPARSLPAGALQVGAA